MTRLLEWLLGLEHIQLGRDAPLSLRLTAPPAAWIQLVAWVVAICAVVYFYGREPLSRRWRWAMITLRMAVIMLVMALVARPALVLRRNKVDPSVTVVLLDRSASMAIGDAGAGQVPSPSVPAIGPSERRWDVAWQALSGSSGLLEALRGKQRVSFWTVGESAYPQWEEPPGGAALPQAPWVDQPPRDERSNLSGGLATVLERTQDRRLAGIVLVSDGRQNAPQRVESLVREAAARGVAIHAVAVGSTAPLRNVVVASVRAEERAFVRDLVAIQAKVEARGLEAPFTVELQLRDTETDEVQATHLRELGGGVSQIEDEFQFRPTRVGRHVLRVVALPRPDEISIDDNQAEAAIDVTDAKARVMYVESRPRFEYRYLKNALVRETTFESSCLLMEADPGFRQEGSRPIARMPVSVEEMSEYDVVILGDVAPNELSPAQVAMLTDFVSVQGGGLIFLAGERCMPRQWADSRLARLMPVRTVRADAPERDRAAEAFHPMLTVEGLASPIFRLELETQETNESIGRLASWYWFAEVEGVQPAATVLAQHPTASGVDGPAPLIVLGRYGAGRVLFIGSDDLWRWRRYGGEAFHENFWLQSIRLLARGKRLGGDAPWRLETDRREYDLAERVEIRAVARDGPPPSDIETIVVEVKAPDGQPADPVVLARLGPESQTFAGTFHPARSGAYALAARPPATEMADLTLEHAIMVRRISPEQRQPEADHDFLRSLAARTGGRFIGPGESAASLAEVIPDRTVQTPDDIEEPLWDSRLAVIAFVGLIAAEWIGRKAKNLL